MQRHAALCGVNRGDFPVELFSLFSGCFNRGHNQARPRDNQRQYSECFFRHDFFSED
jgi:hypothetical protein